jgi:hypothetical protein
MALTKQGLNKAATRICMMPFFPSKDENARALLLVELGAICQSDAHAEWLAIRFTQIFKSQWPGLEELRAVYSKRFRPADGREADSTSGDYAGGFPSEAELGPLQIAGLPEPLPALPERAAAGLVSADPFARRLVRAIAAGDVAGVDGAGEQ